MRYIWINPVAESMYEKSVLREFLEKHQLYQVQCDKDWGTIVKNKYYRESAGGGGSVADARCPMAGELVKKVRAEEGGGCAGLRVADIEPILLHCAREICGREDLKAGEKLITTPCRSLADMGNALGLDNTRFITWNGLLGELGDMPEGRLPNASPIPPGFFEELGLRTESVTGKEEIEDYVRRGRWREVQLTELLYCDQGCHNGDGVTEDE
ncbi:MAG: hypothetical protein LIP16_10400 [Clostridium sp.]|nr:hypothetical protein [Clostridium sp.]